MKETAVHPVGSINEFHLESGNQTFVYVPQGKGIDVGHNATWKPIILVYHDTILDAAGAKKLAEEGGFAELAEKEQCVIMFVNPAGESGWTKDDRKSLLAAVGSTEFENAAYSDGTLLSYDPASGLNQEGKLPGYTERVYIFANGDAADFVSEYILCGQKDVVHYMNGYYKPAAAFLSNVTRAPGTVSTLLESTEMPVYLVNAPADVENFFRKTNKEGHFISVHSDDKSGFSSEEVVAAWDILIGKVRRCYDVVIDIPDYETNFFIENMTFTASTGAELEYYLYSPKAVAKQKDGTAPLVVAMHGKDSSALAMAYLTEWPSLAENNNFLYMGLNHCESALDEEIMEAVQSVIDGHPVIDITKLYMTGFSNGSIHTWNIISNERFKNIFAAAAPMNACIIRDDYRGNKEAVGQLADGSVMPVIFFGATGSHILEMPNQPWFLVNIGEPADVLAYIFARNRITGKYKNHTEHGFWGIKADSEKEVLSKYYQDDNNKLVKIMISSYISEDGHVYTVLAAVTSIHEYEDVNAEIAWEFMNRFSRNPDGTIKLAENDR